VQVVKAFILPVVRAEADRLQSVLEGPLGNNTDRIAADHVKSALLVSIAAYYCACNTYGSATSRLIALYTNTLTKLN